MNRNGSKPKSPKKVLLELKQQVLDAIREYLERRQSKQGMRSDSARTLGITSTRLAALRRGRLELFSLGGLIDIASSLGLRVRLTASRPYKSG